MKEINEIIDTLHFLADKDLIAFKEKKYGIITTNALGIKHSDLASIVKEIKKSDALALALFNTGIYEAKILCSKIYNPKNLTAAQMDEWITHFDNWEICDSFCMALFAKSEFAVQKAKEWTERQHEFEKRAGFATIAAYCMADKKANNKVFEDFLPILLEHATDNRNFVKKAVDWALRNIGKRNKDLLASATVTANKMIALNNKTAASIGNSALKEFGKDNMRSSDYPRHIYRS
jgi:3-methyladenine DNA glycosylase AlkD